MNAAAYPSIFARHACLRSRIGDRIHVLTCTETSTTAVDALTAHIAAIYTEVQNAPPPMHRLLIDNSSVDIQPIKYMLERLREVLPSVNAGHAPTRVALLHSNGLMINMVRVLLNTLTHHALEVRIFCKHEREDAINWLQGE